MCVHYFQMYRDRVCLQLVLSGAVVIGVFIFPVLCYWCLGMLVFEWWW